MSKWKEIIKNWDNILKTDRKSILDSLKLGIPSKYRKYVWSLLTGADKIKAKSEFDYYSLLKNKSESERIIDCDVPRTFPNDQFFTKKMQKPLRNILIAYSNADPEIGYYQGMNFIAALFLYYQDEETAFWSFYSLMQRSHRNFFINKFQHFHELSPLIEHLVEERFPSISAILKKQKMSPILYSPIWLITCFVGSDLDFEMISFIFDEFLAFGEVILISFGMTLISLNKEIAENHTFEEFFTILINPGRSQVMHNPTLVNIEWVNQWITCAQYKKLYDMYVKKNQ